MKKFALAIRWTAIVVLLLGLGTVAGCEDEQLAICLLSFALGAAAVIGFTLLAPRHKRAVALLTFGAGISLSLRMLTLAPEQPYPPYFYIRWSGEWKSSACGVIGSVIGFIVARRLEEKSSASNGGTRVNTIEQHEPASQPSIPASSPIPTRSHQPRNIEEMIQEVSFPGDEDDTLK